MQEKHNLVLHKQGVELTLTLQNRHMKKIFILFCTLFALSAIHAQCPQHLSFDTTVCGGAAINKTIDATILESRLCGDSLTIVFNDSTTSLTGSHQVYFHAGPEFVPFEGWQNAYTQNAPMQKVGTHLWKITFNPRSFFGYSPDSCLNAVACGFTDTLYANYVKCAGTSDIYIVTATGTAVNTCASATFFTATYTHAPVTYHWNDNNTNGVRTFTSGGTYTVTASGVGGCSVTGSVTINLSNKKVSIGDDTTECTTSSYIFVATPGFRTYKWLDANPGTSNTHQAITPLGGIYWVQAVDSFGCVSNDTASVHLSPTGYLSLPATLSSCPGNPVSADASTSINANGDSLVIVYNASLGQSTLAGDTNIYFYSSPQLYSFATWPANDPYTVGTLGSNNGVGRMRSLGNNLWTITIDPQAYYHFSPDSNLLGIWMIFTNYNASKFGKDTNGNNIYVYTVPTVPTSTSDAVTATRKAAQPLTYSWSNGIHTAADTFTTGGVYYVTVTDGICTHSDSVVVSFNSSGTINIGADTTVCSGADSVIISAGSGYAHYIWSNSATTASIKVSGANTYSVTATNAQGCSFIGHRKVSIGGHALSLGPDLIECTTAPVLLTATAGFSSYTWLDRAPSSHDTMTARKTGTYWIAATDSFGCISHDTISVRYSDVLLATMQDTFSSCPGNYVDLDAGSNIAVYGDSITIFYDATQGQSGLVGDSNVYLYSAPQLYPFAGWPVGDPYTRGTYGSNNGVGRMDSLGNNRWSITIFPQSYYGVSPDSTIIGIWMIFTNYNGTKTGKDASGNNIFVNLQPADPLCSFPGVTAIHKEAGTMTYLWSNGAIAPAIAVDSSKHYTVTVSDGTCSKSVSTFVNLANNLSVHLGNDTTVCSGGSVTLNAGAGFGVYDWSNGDTTRSITVNAAGSYSVTVSNGIGCTGSDTVVVSQGASLPPINIGNDTCVAAGHNVIINTGGGYASYVWNTGASTSAIIANQPGSYSVTVTNQAGCSATSDTVIVSNGSSIINLGPDTCINSGGSYLLNAGAGATSYTWSGSGATTDTLRVTATGTYYVTVVDGGCTATDSVVITSCSHVIAGCAPVPYYRVLNVSPANTLTVKDSSYNLYGAVYYYWNFGDNTGIDTTGPGIQVHTYGVPDVYTVTLTVCDSCGCDTFSKVIHVNSTGISEIIGINDVNLYPNPASNNCIMSITASENMELGIDITNILGATIQTPKWQIVSGENKIVLNLSDIASGIYSVTIRSSSGLLTRKLDIVK